MDLDKQIAEAIIKAQVASDGGKKEKSLRHMIHTLFPIWKKGYKNKDVFILQAISLINKSKNSSFRYYVSQGEFMKFMRKKSSLVYFEVKDDNRKRQISFHSFDSRVKRYISHSKRAYRTSWDGHVGGSRLNVAWLVDKYFGERS